MTHCLKTLECWKLFFFSLGIFIGLLACKYISVAYSTSAAVLSIPPFMIEITVVFRVTGIKSPRCLLLHAFPDGKK